MSTPEDAVLLLLLLAAIGYLLGSVPFGLLLTRAAGLGDIRAIGSGNIGATNVLRTGRRGLAAATLVLDMLKGAGAALLGGLAAGPVGALVGGLAAVLGHLFPVWLGFRGGKGVATGLGVIAAASPWLGLLVALVWLAAARLSRRSSVGAIAACIAAPLLAGALRSPLPVILLTLCIGALVIWRHQGNIRRLIDGTEPRIGRKA